MSVHRSPELSIADHGMDPAREHGPAENSSFSDPQSARMSTPGHTRPQEPNMDH